MSLPSLVASIFIPVSHGALGRTIIILAAIIVSLLLSAVFYILVPESMKREARRLHSNGRNKGNIGAHSIEISQHGIVERTDISETRHSWHAVERIADTEHYAFIFFSALMAHVIPKRDHPAAVQEFLKQARSLWADAREDSVAGRQA